MEGLGGSGDVHRPMHTQRTEEDIRSLGTGVVGVCRMPDLFHGCWDPISELQSS